MILSSQLGTPTSLGRQQQLRGRAACLACIQQLQRAALPPAERGQVPAGLGQGQAYAGHPCVLLLQA